MSYFWENESREKSLVVETEIYIKASCDAFNFSREVESLLYTGCGRYQNGFKGILRNLEGYQET